MPRANRPRHDAAARAARTFVAVGVGTAALVCTMAFVGRPHPRCGMHRRPAAMAVEPLRRDVAPPPAVVPAFDPVGTDVEAPVEAAPLDDCSPVFYYDARGRKHYKPSCLRAK
jgi:hypothetical protein